jgi:hypothetical protein
MNRVRLGIMIRVSGMRPGAGIAAADLDPSFVPLPSLH